MPFFYRSSRSPRGRAGRRFVTTALLVVTVTTTSSLLSCAAFTTIRPPCGSAALGVGRTPAFVAPSSLSAPRTLTTTRTTLSSLSAKKRNRLFRFFFGDKTPTNVDDEDEVVEAEVTEGEGLLDGIKNQFPEDEFEAEPEPEPVVVDDVSICVIGGGVSGLAAAITAAEEIAKRNAEVDVSKEGVKILVLEKSPRLGGRVASDTTDDGYTLDCGFAVFIEEYPFSKKLLDYDQLKLGRFVPGSLVKTTSSEGGGLYKVADPLRVPSDLLTAILAPVGTLFDKIKVLPLLYHVFTRTVDELFAEDETDTLTCLQDRYGFSPIFIQQFFTPFLEGIYLAPLNEQSSRMFHFVFKMFSEGAATLPQGGMGKVADLLVSNAKAADIDLRTDSALESISFDDDDGRITVTASDGSVTRANALILATDGRVAQQILSAQVPGFAAVTSEQTQRSVGCVYYGFDTEVPVREPILILNGAADRASPRTAPVNNICFPSEVNTGYAPAGCGLCSVTILRPALDAFFGDDGSGGGEEALDRAVRAQLMTWFPDIARDIKDGWDFKGMYRVDNAQPAQLNGPTPANVNGGRDCTKFRGEPLPKGLLLCGDHMATATLNGALESGVNAGLEAVKLLV